MSEGFNCSITCQSMIYIEEVKIEFIENAIEFSKSYSTLARFAAFPIALCCVALDVAQRVSGIGESLTKGLGNILGAVFSDECKPLKGLRQLLVQLPSELVDTFLVVLLSPFSLVGSTISIFVNPADSLEDRKNESKQHNNLLKLGTGYKASEFDNSSAVLAEKNASHSSFSVKNNPTHESDHVEPTNNKSDKPSAGITNEAMNSLGNSPDLPPSVEKNKKPPLPPRAFSLSIGSFQASVIVQKILAQVPHIEVFNSTGGTSWNRDLQVCLPWTGDEIRSNSLEESDVAKISELANRFLPYNQPYRLSKGNGIPTSLAGTMTDSKLCLEGGNVKFWEHSGRRGAIVGTNSIFFSMASMEGKGCFTHKAIESEVESLHLEDLNPLISKAYVRKENDPRSEGEITKEVQEFAAKWNLTKKQIAYELKIDSANLIILEHALDNIHPELRVRLHIDLDVLVGLDNKVFLNDARLSKEALDRLPLSGKKSNDYSRIAETMCSDADTQIFERNRATLEKHGFEVVGVPGFFDLGNQQGGQFLNGLLLSRTDKAGKAILLSPSVVFNQMIFDRKKDLSPLVVLSQGNDEAHRLAQTFHDMMAKHQVKVIFVDCAGAPGGGLHCLTQELRSSELGEFVPQAIPVDIKQLQPVVSQIKVIVKREFFDKFTTLTFQSKDKRVKENFNSIYPGGPFTITVYLLKPTPFDLLANGTEKIEVQERLLLPGHPQYIDLRNT